MSSAVGVPQAVGGPQVPSRQTSRPARGPALQVERSKPDSDSESPLTPTPIRRPRARMTDGAASRATAARARDSDCPATSRQDPGQAGLRPAQARLSEQAIPLHCLRVPSVWPCTAVPLKRRSDKRAGHIRTQRRPGPCQADPSGEPTTAAPSARAEPRARSPGLHHAGPASHGSSRSQARGTGPMAALSKIGIRKLWVSGATTSGGAAGGAAAAAGDGGAAAGGGCACLHPRRGRARV